MDAILAQGSRKLVDALTAEKIDLSALSLDQRRDLLAPGRALRPVDRRADRAALEPAAPPVGLPAALEPPRPSDRLRHDADRRWS